MCIRDSEQGHSQIVVLMTKAEIIDPKLRELEAWSKQPSIKQHSDHIVEHLAKCGGSPALGEHLRKHARMIQAQTFLGWLIDSEGRYLAHMPEEEAEFVRLLVGGAGVAALDFQDPQHHGRTALLRACLLYTSPSPRD